EGNPVSITVKSNAPRYRWEPGLYLNCDTCKTVLVNAPDTMTYQVVAINQYGCETKASLTVHVDQLPKLLDTLAVNLCKNDEYQLYVGHANYMEWTPALFLDDSNAIYPMVNPQHSIEYQVTGYNVLGCTTTA